MALSDYTGRRPGGTNGRTRIVRIVRHHRWDPEDDAVKPCINCGERLQLHERHVLVTLDEGASGDARYHLCDESCVRRWVDGE
ncbi:DUF7576 family protein [Halegenticoccus tardaugens]|uniref:DUF7576 family protein n=1 Tax=Halegenticoccus tardaugens TaxID=2071624 RepID=UPI00100B7245|nr:hypothetical protein [Halegenticoccus tardaugens]